MYGSQTTNRHPDCLLRNLYCFSHDGKPFCLKTGVEAGFDLTSGPRLMPFQGLCLILSGTSISYKCCSRNVLDNSKWLYDMYFFLISYLGNSFLESREFYNQKRPEVWFGVRGGYGGGSPRFEPVLNVALYRFLTLSTFPAPFSMIVTFV